jgi:hypothetical protein
VPFVGAGVSRSILKTDGSPAFPTWGEFLEVGRQRLGRLASEECAEALTRGDYLAAAEIIKANLSEPGWVRLLKSTFGIAYDALQRDTLDLPAAVWRCSRGLVVTTNYDNALAWAAPDGMQPGLRRFGLEAPIDLSTILQADVQQPILWHLHGRVDFPSSVVIAPDGYGQLYGGDPSVPKRYSQAIFALRHLIATHSLLFVGFSLTDANVVAELQQMHELFDEAGHSHFVIVRSADVNGIERKITDVGLGNIELLEVADFGQPLVDMLTAISATGAPPAAPAVLALRRPVDPSRHLHLRRRCRSVLVGSAGFRAKVGPCIAEHRQQDYASVLVQVLAEARSRVEKRLAQTILHELNGAIELMAECSDPNGFTGKARANLALFHAIGLEKLNRLPEAIAWNDGIIADTGLADELRLCAQFNIEVCREKAGDAAVTFEPWLADRARRLSTGELIWPKAFSMELISCSKNGRSFRYADLLDEAIAAEISQATTGFGKTIINWAHYARLPLDAATVSEIWRVAGHASVNVRVAMLGDLSAVVEDAQLAQAIDDSLEASAAVSQRSDTVLRVIARLAAHGR